MTKTCERCQDHPAAKNKSICKNCMTALRAKKDKWHLGPLSRGIRNSRVHNNNQLRKSEDRRTGHEPSLPIVKWLEREMP